MAQNGVLGSLPSGGHRNLATGVAVFRVASMAWMIGFNLISAGWARAWLAYLCFGAIIGWTTWLFFHRGDQDRAWVLWLDLALSTFVVLASALVVPPGAVTSSRLFFATAYPISTPLMWGMFRGVLGGMLSAFTLSVALVLTRPLNGIAFGHLSQIVGLANGSAYFFIAGGTMGAIRMSLDRAARSVSEAVERAMKEQDLAAKEQTRAAELAVRLDLRDEIHGGVVQDLGLLRRRLRELIARRPDDDALPGLDRSLSQALDKLRHVITRRRAELPAGIASLEDWLIDTKRRVPEVSATLSVGALVGLPTSSARALCAAVEQALRNIEQHAAVSTGWIFADVEDGTLQVRVIDRGAGFSHDPDRPAASGHPGIDAMRRYVEGVGGKMGIVTAPGMGTTVEFRVPL